MRDLSKLRAEAGALQARLWEAERLERIRASLARLGACYKFHNSYGRDEQWWLYVRIVDVDDHGWPVVFKFQTRHNGSIEIEPRALGSAVNESDGYKRCEPAELEREWQAVQDRICNTLSPEICDTLATPVREP